MIQLICIRFSQIKVDFEGGKYVTFDVFAQVSLLGLDSLKLILAGEDVPNVSLTFARVSDTSDHSYVNEGLAINYTVRFAPLGKLSQDEINAKIDSIK